MSRFQDKSIIVTGAGSGLGRTTAERLGAEGANLLLVDFCSSTSTPTDST